MATRDTTKKSAGQTRSSKSDAKSEGDLGASQVQEQVDEENEQGFRGDKVDPTDDRNYSLLTPADAPTPETDAGAAKDAREATRIGVSPLEANERRGK